MKTKWKSAVITFFFTLLGVLGACTRGGVEAGQGDPPPSISPADQGFVMKNAVANVAKIDMARSALKNSRTSDVRDFANMIQTDGIRALEDLTDLMKDKNVSQKTASLPADVGRDIRRMAGLTGAEFDREFINMMVADLQQAVEMFRDESAAATDADVKKYADGLLPTLEMHLEKALRLQSKLFNARQSTRHD